MTIKMDSSRKLKDKNQMRGRIMDIEMKCLRCGSTNVKPSELQSTGKIYARPKNAKLTTVFTTGAQVRALTCLDCGHVEMLVDTKKAKALIRTA
jgi:predicted nucleic-acid-binding Zn-ribbon protein